ncbi:MAG TPA: PAS domain-containing protein [Candidatus Cloacimonadota bacterium]|nr:PAS domain-containing protein [Candidatus Cloacimonadota bacterium]HPT71210.1 PAS domain-containing protein [Candidatus Cloacimonadota bacterium]
MFPALIDNLEDNIAEIDSNLVIRNMNIAFLRHLKSAGYEGNPIGQDIFAVLPVASDLKHYFESVLFSGNMIQFKRKSPNPAIDKLFLISLLPLKDADKETKGILFLSHEIKKGHSI